MIKNQIQERDIQVLNELEKIVYEPDSNDKNRFSLIFEFDYKNNEFFSHPNLIKTFYLRSDDEPIKSEGTQIEFKEGKDVTKKTVKKTQKNKKTGAKR